MAESSTKNPDQNKSQSAQHETAQKAAEVAAEYGQEFSQHYVKEPAKDLIQLAKSYAKDKPDVAACWAFCLGVIVGWKLRP